MEKLIPPQKVMSVARRNLTPGEAKARMIETIGRGWSVAEACKAVGKSVKTHEYYMASDENYRAAVLAIRASQGRREGTTPIPDFRTFRKTYLNRGTYWHQQQWIDLLEGQDPSDLHPAEIYQKGDPAWLILNTPPEFSKSTTITVDYVIYRICENPNVRIVIVSKTREFAKKFLYQIKTILTHPKYAKLQADFAPPGGFKADSDSWTADSIYLGQGSRDSGEKDPTVQVLGMGQQIYGARADLIILDDCVVLANAHEFEKQIWWITQEVLTRPSSNGVILVVGTRVAPQDLYSELRNGTRYEEGDSPWTYFAQPAVLEFNDDPQQWVTLWPRTEVPCGCRQICHGNVDPAADGLHPKWDGLHLSRRRGALTRDAATWARVYMQMDVAEDQVFRPECVAASINGRRVTGPLLRGAIGHPEHGGEGHYVIGSMDPAMAGCTAAVVYSVDRGTHKRYVIDLHNQAHMTPLAIRQLIKFWTIKYGINEWRIEDNAFQGYLAQDQELRDWLATRGCVLNPHRTGKNKWDPDFGVASMSVLFGDVDDRGEVTRAPLIELPSTKQNQAVKDLVEQLIVWQPEDVRGRTVKTDLVMALWFAEIRAREILSERMFSGTHVPNKYVVPYQKRQQMSVNLDDAWMAKQLGRPDLDLLPVQPLTPALPGPWQT